MPNDARIYLVMIAIGASLIFLVSLVPPLTSGNSAVASGVSQAEFDAAVAAEMEHCEALGGGLDCQCYAGISGYVRALEPPRVPFTRSLDQTELARRQAAHSC
ncbi:hypothetical protein [uncultured Tateyamaria sp.]|uniref:hypothetical protein n=1 Tax=uncultured Tateyamaria sp. TaxID=455651 RepID=UPI00261C518B|nr:hypothetical protein [uncultured Tateyamaria sp.]